MLLGIYISQEYQMKKSFSVSVPPLALVKITWNYNLWGSYNNGSIVSNNSFKWFRKIEVFLVVQIFRIVL